MTAPAPQRIDPWGSGPDSLLVRAQMHQNVCRGDVAVAWDRKTETWTVNGVAGLTFEAALAALGGAR